MPSRWMEQLRTTRAFTLSLVEDLRDDQLAVAHLDTVNPFLWELGHVGFFYDTCVRGHLDGAAPLLEEAERYYDSFAVAHDERWRLPMPDRSGTLAYLQRVQDEIEARLAHRDLSGTSTACLDLALRHEDMHGEAFLQMRQTLRMPAPPWMESASRAAGPCPGDAQISGGTFSLGTPADTEVFVLDNERWQHEVELADFAIARAPVTQAEYREFVEAGGYEDDRLWSRAGSAWRRRTKRGAPAHWRRGDQGWERRAFDQWVALEPHQPMIHVNWFEANAFCAWSGRRLPTEAEWERAAAGGRFPWRPQAVSSEPDPAAFLADRAHFGAAESSCADVGAYDQGDSPDGCRQLLGNVWEWTSSAFYPFPGFVVEEPYREYSAPWFGDRKVLKGGSFATPARLVYVHFRNFFTPDRADIFAGFRTCAR